jgi:hypothetical protein
MEDVLSSEAVSDALLDFMRAEHSEESFEFCMDVIFFRERCPDSKLVATALNMFATYVDSAALKQVNLPAHVFKKLNDVQSGLLKGGTVRDGAPPLGVARDLFNEAQDTLTTIIEHGPLRRFLQTCPTKTVLLEEGVERGKGGHRGPEDLDVSKKRVAFEASALIRANRKRFNAEGRTTMGVARVQSAWDKVVLYGQRPDLDIYDDFPTLVKKFRVVKVWCDRPMMDNLVPRACHHAKVMHAWRVQTYDEVLCETFEHSISVRRRTEVGCFFDRTIVSIVVDKGVISESDLKSMLFSSATNTTDLHSWVEHERFADGRETGRVTEFSVQMQGFGGDLTLRVNGSTFGNKQPPKHTPRPSKPVSVPGAIPSRNCTGKLCGMPFGGIPYLSHGE